MSDGMAVPVRCGWSAGCASAASLQSGVGTVQYEAARIELGVKRMFHRGSFRVRVICKRQMKTAREQGILKHESPDTQRLRWRCIAALCRGGNTGARTQ